MRSLSSRIIITLAVVAVVLRGLSAVACLNWPEVACHYWADFIAYGSQGLYWRTTGITTVLFLTIAFVAGISVWWMLKPEEITAEERRDIGQAVLDEAMDQTKSKVPVPVAVEERFTARFWNRWEKLFGKR